MQAVAERKTNLTYISEVANAAIDREAESPTLGDAVKLKASREKTLSIAGFRVMDTSVEERILDEGKELRKTAVANYRSHREAAKYTLDKANITPLALLPKAAWDAICSATGLYQLAPDHEGAVKASTWPYIQRLNRLSVPISICLWALPILLGGWGIYSLCHSHYSTPTQVLGTIGMVVAIIIHFCLGLATSESEGPYMKVPPLVEKLLLWLRYRHMTDFQAVKMFFPNNSESRNGTLVGLSLPEPPTDVAETLLKAHKANIRLKVALVPEAISFTETPYQILTRDHQARVKEKERQRELAREFKNDPIAYYEVGSAVAIIAQFGDFPIEKEVVDRVVNSEHII